jgi:hypothetical protein
MPAYQPHDIIKTPVDTPVLNQYGVPERRANGAVPMRRTITYANGDVEIYEYDQNNPPPSPGMPWGTLVGTTRDQQTYGDYQREVAAEAKTAATEAKTEREGPKYVTLPGGRGLARYNPETDRLESVEGTEVPEKPQEPRDVHFSPTGAIRDPLTGDLIGYQQDVLEQQRQKAATDRQQEILNLAKFNFETGKWTAEQAKAEYDRMYKLMVEEPRLRAAQQLQLRQEERLGINEVQRAAEAAGTSAVSDVVSRMPYMYSPGFAERRRAILDAGLRGGYAPSAAGTIQLPDLAQTRQDAQSAAQARSAALLGIDLDGGAYAGIPPYTGPPPLGAVQLNPRAYHGAAPAVDLSQVQGLEAPLGPAAAPPLPEPIAYGGRPPAPLPPAGDRSLYDGTRGRNGIPYNDDVYGGRTMEYNYRRDAPTGDLYAGVPLYAGPPPAGAVLPSPEDDAAEWARRLAGARQRVGPAVLSPTPLPAAATMTQPADADYWRRWQLAQTQ